MAKCCKGQSLIEVIVAVGMISVLLVALLALVTLSLKNSRLAKARAQAVSLAQEGVELMRAYRAYNWSTMYSLADADYTLPQNWVVADGLSLPCDNEVNINGIFWRCVRLDIIDANEISSVVTVGWTEGGQDLSTTQSTQLSLWER